MQERATNWTKRSVEAETGRLVKFRGVNRVNEAKLSMFSLKPLLFKVGSFTESFSSLAAGLHGVSSVLVLLSLLRGVASKHGRTKTDFVQQEVKN